MTAAEHGDQKTSGQEVDDVDLKYAKWRSGLCFQTWEERASQRASHVKSMEDQYRRLQRQRQEEEQRLQLEKRRQEEAAARAEQRRKEAAEYSAWRADAVLARRAEERTRAAEHNAWRNHLKKLGRGLVVSGGSDVSASAVKQSSSSGFTPRSTSHGDAIHRGRPSAWAEITFSPSLGICWPFCGGFVDKFVDQSDMNSDQRYVYDHQDAIYASTPPSWKVASEDQQRLAEDDAWKVLVERNKEAIRVERAQREAEAVRRREHEQRQKILATVPG